MKTSPIRRWQWLHAGSPSTRQPIDSLRFYKFAPNQIGTLFSILLGTKDKSTINDDNVLLATESPDEKVAFGKTGQAKKMWEEKKEKAKQLLSPETYKQYCFNQDAQYPETM